MSLPRTQEKTSSHSLTDFFSSASAGALEIAVFHPLDTVQKRLMKNPYPIYDMKLSFTENTKNIFNITLRDPKTQRISLYPGVGWGLFYKIPQRVYKFTAQPIVEKYLKDHYMTESNTFWLKGISGAVVGAGEVWLLPLDIAKLRKQLGSETQGNDNIRRLYRGIGVTIIRNTFGSFCLFGMPELMKKALAGEKKPTDMQKLVAQFTGAATSIIVASPFDVIKTRIQAVPANVQPDSAWKIGGDILINNPSQFFKSVTSKISGQGIKLTAFLWAKDAISEKIEKKMGQ